MWRAADPSHWAGRADPGDGEAGLRWHQVIAESEDGVPAGTCLLGFASDTGVRRNQGRPGAAEGPAALRRAMANLPAGGGALYDGGDVVAGEDLEAAQAEYAGRLARHLAAGHFVLGLGGGHEIAWGAWQGLTRWLADSGAPSGLTIGIVNFDAHFDLRDAGAGSTSGTPFRQIADSCERDGRAFNYLCLGVSEAANTRALFEAADARGVRYLRDVDCELDAALPMMEEFVAGLDCLYVTVCLDALPAAVAPGVSAPAALGIPPRVLIRCLAALRRLCSAGRCRWPMADIAELCPRLDIDGRSARIAARVGWEICR